MCDTESSLSDLKTSLPKSVSLVIGTSAEEVIDSVSEVKLALTSAGIDATNEINIPGLLSHMASKVLVDVEDQKPAIVKHAGHCSFQQSGNNILTCTLGCGETVELKVTPGTNSSSGNM